VAKEDIVGETVPTTITSRILPANQAAVFHLAANTDSVEGSMVVNMVMVEGSMVANVGMVEGSLVVNMATDRSSLIQRRRSTK